MTNTVSNPQSRMELLALAERVERVTADDAELFYDAFREAFPKPETVWEIPYETWTYKYSEWQQRQTRFYELVEVGAFIDAAMTLKPEGRCWGLFDDGTAWLWDSPQRDLLAGVQQKAATPALALVAACLRSIAAEGE
jgi:hypothetical protein